MKWLFAVVGILFLATACSESVSIDYCGDYLDVETDADRWELAKCFEETAIERMDILICNGIGNPVSIETEERVYSRSTCRASVYYTIAINGGNPQKCEMIDTTVEFYSTVPEEATFTNGAKLKSLCKDAFNI